MATRGSYAHNAMMVWKFWGIPKNVRFMQFFQNTESFRQNDSQGV